MTERPYVISVDLGEAAYTALLRSSEQAKKNRSEVVKDAVMLYEALKLYDIRDRALVALERKPNKSKHPMTDGERMIVDVYRQVFDYQGRVFYPAYLRAARAAQKTGLTCDDLAELVRIAPQDDLLIKKGKRPSLHELMSGGWISRLLNLKDEALADQKLEQELRVENEIKPGLLDELKGLLDKNAYSKAYDDMKIARTEAEVEHVYNAYRRTSGAALAD